YTITGHVDAVTGLAFAPDGTKLASCSLDGTVKLWLLADGSLITTLSAPGQRALNCIAFSSDGLSLAAGEQGEGSTAAVLMWRVADFSLARTVPLGTNEVVQTLAYSPDNTLLASFNPEFSVLDRRLPAGPRDTASQPGRAAGNSGSAGSRY